MATGDQSVQEGENPLDQQAANTHEVSPNEGKTNKKPAGIVAAVNANLGGMDFDGDSDEEHEADNNVGRQTEMVASRS